jgi:hypothetical protein
LAGGGIQRGTSPEEVAAALLAHVEKPDESRLRLLIGEDAPGHVEAALKLRHEDYERDPQFHSR